MRKGNLGCILEECLTVLLPVVTCIVENMPNEFVDLDKGISRQNVEMPLVFFQLLMIKYTRKKKP